MGPRIPGRDLGDASPVHKDLEEERRDAQAQEAYDVQNDCPHDARGDSKALAHCLAKALRRHEKPPVCHKPLTLDVFKEKFWREHQNWVDKALPGVKEKNSITLETGCVDLRVALAKGSAEVEVETDPDSNERRVKARLTTGDGPDDDCT